MSRTKRNQTFHSINKKNTIGTLKVKIIIKIFYLHAYLHRSFISSVSLLPNKTFQNIIIKVRSFIHDFIVILSYTCPFAQKLSYVPRCYCGEVKTS